jgi:hypothetical protein
LPALRQDHLDRLRDARRRRPGERSARSALHLPPMTSFAPPTAGPRRPAVRAAWPRRRLVVAAALAPLALVLLAAASGGWAGASPTWTALVAGVAVASAATLATYVPLPGTAHRLDVGCTPCTAVAGLGVVAAALVLSSAPHDVPTAMIALAAVGFGLSRRLAGPATCPSAPP